MTDTVEDWSFPADWGVAVLGHEISLRAGVSVNSVDESLHVDPHQQQILKTSAVSEGRFLPEEAKKIALSDLPRATLSPVADSIVISRMNTPDLVGECGYVPRDHPELFLPDRLWLALPRAGSDISLKWLAYLLSNTRYRRMVRSAATGTSGSMKNISRAALLSLEIPYPTRREQLAIADCLDAADSLLESLGRLIGKKRDLKQAVLQRLLSGRTRLPGFQSDWQTTRLGAVAEMRSGGTPRSSVAAFYDGDIPWVSISDMTGSGKVIRSTARCLSPRGLAESSAQMYPLGTVLYAMYASLGECGIAGVPLCSSQAILGIRPKVGLDSEFLYYVLSSMKSKVRTMGQHGTQANLNAGMVRDFQIPLPSISEQRGIASVLSDMDAELAALGARLAKTRDLKQAMAQELLSGRTRLA